MSTSTGAGGANTGEPTKGASGQSDSPKRHGDKFASGADPQVTAPQNGPSGDSPKPHGEKLRQAVAGAAKE